MERSIQITGDGSKTIFVKELNEQYHSTHGAVQESMHVFITTGLACFQEYSSIRIFEAGFGTGLNCFLSWLHFPEKEIIYHAVELFPVEDAIIEKLEYAKHLMPDETGNHIFKSIHKAEWECEVEIAPGFRLKKTQVDLAKFTTKETYNLIYFDAFSPNVQPELWTRDVFAGMFSMLAPGGILVTYCSKGEVRRSLQSCGFSVERLPGPPGKREILRAIKA